MGQSGINNILVVDDDEHLRESISFFLRRKDYICLVADSSSAALEVLKGNDIDLVVSDVVMQGMDGLEMMKRAKEIYPNIDFIIMTGHASEYSYGDIIKAGASDYMIKPFDLVELVARVKRVDREKRIMGELTRSNQKLESAIEEAKKMAEKAESASKAKSEFLASMSHEIRTPLNAMIGFTDILMDTSMDDEQADYVKNIKVSSEALLSLINDILDGSKIEAGKMSLESIDFDPEVLCYEVCELIRPRIRKKSVELVCRIGNDLPSRVSGDPFRFRQVLLNLLSNSAKFTESGKIELFIDAKEEGERIRLTTIVSDTGIGIPKDKRDIIFEPFRQAGRDVPGRYGGTGLGLSICEKIARLMEGRIWVESEPGKGSRFFFSAIMDNSESHQRKRSNPVEISGKKIMVAGAGYTNTKILERVLKTKRVELSFVKNSEEAIGLLKKAHDCGSGVDLCIIDISEDEKAGFELVKSIKNNSPSTIAAMPLVALAPAIAGCAKKCEQAGFDGFISKPIHRARLFQMMEQILGLSGRKESRNSFDISSIMTQHSVHEDRKQAVRIMVAEDNPVNLKLAMTILKKAGYEVFPVTNGQDACREYFNDPSGFDIILMDVQMPEMDGMEASMAIRKWEEGRSGFTSGKRMKIPIVALTANAMQEDRGKCIDAGMDDYISKPIKRELVFKAIEKWVL